MEVKDLGLIEYKESLKIQDEAVAKVAADPSREIILVCEHPEVITLGRAPGSRDEVFSTNVPVVEIPRGGRATLHLPGQVVVYPIVDLKKRDKDLHRFMRLLEHAITDTLSDFRIDAATIDGKTGVWIPRSKRGEGERKIASIGIAVKHWVTYHGLALNVSCDLSLFKNISPCGFSSEIMTSVFDELSDDYKKTWALDSRNLFARVKTRIAENLLERFSGEVSPDDLVGSLKSPEVQMSSRPIKGEA